MSITEALLRPLLSASAARPLITHYDDAVGSRIELSVATLANWAAKTANWLTDEFDIEPGEAICVRLPAHWQTAGVLLGAWWCGGHVVQSPKGARVAFVGPDGVDEATGAEAVAVVALDALGRGLAAPAEGGALDYLSEARMSGDEYRPILPIPGDTPALASSTVDEVLAEAARRAVELGIGAGDRVLSIRDWTVPDGVLDALVAPLSAGASIVQVTGGAVDQLADRRATERTTVDLPG
ncbi:MAG: TIGR03089 family protein [Haloechinothrix sp.]